MSQTAPWRIRDAICVFRLAAIFAGAALSIRT
jgi:hypothetical protein